MEENRQDGLGMFLELGAHAESEEDIYMIEESEDELE
jgi:hypothetical protein